MMSPKGVLMNKLVLSTKEELKENLEVLEIIGEKTELRLSGEIEMDSILFPVEEFETTWILEEGSKVKICIAQEISNLKGKIHLISNENVHLVFHFGMYAKGDNHLEILHEQVKNHSECEMKIRIATSEDSKVFLKATGAILRDTHGNVYLEDIKYLNEYPGSIVCLPELFVESDDTEANHNMTVSGIDDETLFHLESRGIDRGSAKELIYKSFVESMSRKDRDYL